MDKRVKAMALARKYLGKTWMAKLPYDYIIRYYDGLYYVVRGLDGKIVRVESSLTQAENDVKSLLGSKPAIVFEILSDTSKIKFYNGTDFTNYITPTDAELTFSKIKFSSVHLEETLTGELHLRENNTGVLNKKFVSYKISAQYFGEHFATVTMRTASATTYTLKLQSHDGTAYVDNIKLQGGTVELYNAKLTSFLNADGNDITNINNLLGRVGPYSLVITSRRTAANAGDGLFIRSYNASDVATDRIVITSGVNAADIKIVNAYLDFADQEIETEAGSQAGYIQIKVGGTVYLVPIYNTL